MKRILAIILCLVFLVSCKNANVDDQVKDEVDINIGCTTYPSSYAQAILLNEIITREGYTAKIIMDDTDTMWNNLGEGKTDVILSGWIPTIDTKRKQKIESSIRDLGTNCRELSNGIYVPNYAIIGFLSELDEYKEEFQKTIYVCKESEITSKEVNLLLDQYNLQYTIKQINYSDLDRIISNSIKQKEWIAIALWSPNGIINKYNLRKLRDSNKIFTNDIDTHTIVNSEYDNEEILNILDNYFVRTNELNELINNLSENNKPKKTVNNFLNDNIQILNRASKIY